MKRRALLIFASSAAVAWAFASASAAEPAIDSGRSTGAAACTSSERWEHGEVVPVRWGEAFAATVSGRSSAVRSFAEALAFRRLAESDEGRHFAEYWISRALHQGGMIQVAQRGFALLAARAPSAVSAGAQLAALDCLNQIRRKYPAFPAPEAVLARLPALSKFAATPAQKQVIHEAALTRALVQLSLDRSETELEASLALIEWPAQERTLLRAFISARASRHAAVISELEPFLAAPTAEHLERYRDHARILLARSRFARGEHGKASEQLKLVRKSSNELAETLSEQAWSHLMDGRHGEAVGAALSLKAGGLRNTFAPEAPMVTAMAMNELCQFPGALRAIDSFRRGYETTWRWLETWSEASNHQPLYPEVVRHLRKQSKAPKALASEWVRSSIFISHQDAINLGFEEKASAQRLAKGGAREQSELVKKIRANAVALRDKVRFARSQLKVGESLPGTLRAELNELRLSLELYRQLRAAAPVWKSVAAAHRRLLPGVERKLVANIEHDLRDRSLRMLERLREIAENNQLVEVEIFEGASRDIIWQNANPEYRGVARDISSENAAEGPVASKVWNWGRTPSSAAEGGEIWEDELGNFNADLTDNCSNRERYLALKKKMRKST